MQFNIISASSKKKKAKQNVASSSSVEERCGPEQPSLNFINSALVHPDYSKCIHFPRLVKKRINEPF